MTAKTLWILSAAALLAVSVCQVRTIHLHYTINMQSTGASESRAVSNTLDGVTCQTNFPSALLTVSNTQVTL